MRVWRIFITLLALSCSDLRSSEPPDAYEQMVRVVKGGDVVELEAELSRIGGIDADFSPMHPNKPAIEIVALYGSIAQMEYLLDAGASSARGPVIAAQNGRPPCFTTS